MAKIELFQNMVMFHFQIKGNDACSNMVANIIPADTPIHPNHRDWVKRPKLNFFRTWPCCISF